MVQRLATIAIVLALVGVGLLLCLDVAYFVHGSLEEFPTAEQDDKIRRVAAVLAVMLVGVGLGLWLALRRLGRHGRLASAATVSSAHQPPDDAR
jgi:hypothetical protein